MGTIYYDAADDDMMNGPDYGLSGVVVYLSGTDYLGMSYFFTGTTDANGDYSFTGLFSGTYDVWYTTAPAAYTPDSVQPGNTTGSIASGIQSITSIDVAPNTTSENNDF